MTHEPRIRPMRDSDADFFTEAERAQGWYTEQEKFFLRLRDQAEGQAVALVAECDGETAGYIHVHPDAQEGLLAGRAWPEIVDFAVLGRFRGCGIGGKLMDAAETIAARYADTVYLGVGLHSGYGAAQRMVIRRDYVPDGSGVWYGNQPCPPYAPLPQQQRPGAGSVQAAGRAAGGAVAVKMCRSRTFLPAEARAAGLTCV